MDYSWLTYTITVYFAVVALWGLKGQQCTALLLYAGGLANILMLQLDPGMVWGYRGGILWPMYGATIDGLIAILILVVGDSWRIRNGLLLLASLAINAAWLILLGLEIPHDNGLILRALACVTMLQIVGGWRGILGPYFRMRRRYMDWRTRLRRAPAYGEARS